MEQQLTVPESVLAAYGLESPRIAPLGSGLINETWRIDSERGSFVLQRVNPIFPADINRDIDAVTRHIAASGLVTLQLVPNRHAELWTTYAERNWRLLTYIDGVSHDALSTPAQAKSAGALLVAFHRAVDDLEHEFSSPRLGIHDTARHLEFLHETLRTKSGHPRHADIRRLAERIFAAARELAPLPAMPDRIVHGDPKINNLLFTRDSDLAFSLVDLDTLARMPLPLELGDALRSWCNPAGEDDRVSEFSAQLFAEAIRGYAQGAAGWMIAAETASIVTATETILIELASRFCADALNESYFGWNPERFASRSEHNQARAASQLHVAESLAAQRSELEKIVSSTFK